MISVSEIAVFVTIVCTIINFMILCRTLKETPEEYIKRIKDEE